MNPLDFINPVYFGLLWVALFVVIGRVAFKLQSYLAAERGVGSAEIIVIFLYSAFMAGVVTSVVAAPPIRP